MNTRPSPKIARPSTSLRVRLTAIILVPLMIIAMAVGIWQLDYTRQKAEGLFDRSLLSTGLAIAADVARSGGDALSLETRDLLNDTSGGQVYYHAFAPSGVYVTGYATPPARPPEAVAAIGDGFYGFYDSTYFGSPVRALRLRQVNTVSGISGTYTYTVWQERAVLDALARDLAWQVKVVMAVLIGTVALVVWFGVNLGLRPLLNLEDAISRRSADDLSPIRRRVPPEARGLVLRLNALFEQVEATIQAQASFVSNAAHQLRNPIAGVLAMAEAVRRAPTPEDTRARAGELLTSARQVRDLANRLLTLERASAAGQARERVDLAALLAQIGADREGACAAQSVDLERDFQGTQAVVMADRLMLREAVLNLIDNALRHGGPTLSRITIGLGQQDDHACLWVQDDGRGLRPEEVPLALARFGQVGTAEGSGLGLSITAAVLAAHDGTLEIDPSDATQGGLRVRMQLALAGPDGQSEPMAAPASARRPRYLAHVTAQSRRPASAAGSRQP
ncbi:sensor histidine kinase [Roseicyclus sp.]|uniref:sensor histidine kinase n=1 Tax=Roseicyclus sp. TaxID=1914329 RepID=UPI003F6BD685